MKLANKSDCTGCGACASICPKNCIDIKPDKEGFFFPIVNNKECINCGACTSVCPFLYDKYIELQNTEIDAYALKNKDLNVLKESSSGGAFTSIIQILNNGDTTIYGAAIQKDLTTKQVRIDDMKNLNILRKSKYVESYSGTIYKQVLNDLIQNKRVVYSGTPCQIAGLKSFLGKRTFDELYTIDIICHGVPTSLLLKKYMENKEALFKSKIKNIEYRSKIKSNWLNPKIRLEFVNGKVYEQKSFACDDEYMIGFCDFLCLRESCHNCKFANPNRISDFTIGDFWGVESINFPIEYKNGISLLLANTDKAKKLISNLSSVAEIIEIDYTFAKKHNSQLVEPCKPDSRRNQFLFDLINLPYTEVENKYLKPRSKIINILSNLLSRRTKAFIKQTIGRKPTKY